MARPAVDILGIDVPWDERKSRYSVAHKGFIFAIDIIDRDWTGYITYLDVVIWQGQYPSLVIMVDRMEQFITSLRNGLVALIEG